MYVVVINVTDDVNAVLQYVIVQCCNSPYKSCLLYFAFLAVIAALKVTMSVRNKSYTSCNAAVSLCVLLQSM